MILLKAGAHIPISLANKDVLDQSIAIISVLQIN